jgi:hypothetical protein
MWIYLILVLSVHTQPRHDPHQTGGGQGEAPGTSCMEYPHNPGPAEVRQYIHPDKMAHNLIVSLLWLEMI